MCCFTLFFTEGLCSLKGLNFRSSIDLSSSIYDLLDLILWPFHKPQTFCALQVLSSEEKNKVRIKMKKFDINDQL